MSQVRCLVQRSPRAKRFSERWTSVGRQWETLPARERSNVDVSTTQKRLASASDQRRDEFRPLHFELEELS